MTPPKHIWSGGWEAESEEDARRRAEAEAERLAHPEPEPDPAAESRARAARANAAAGGGAGVRPETGQRSGLTRGRIAALVIVSLLAVGGGAFAAGALLDNGDDSKGIARPAA